MENNKSILKRELEAAQVKWFETEAESLYHQNYKRFGRKYSRVVASTNQPSLGANDDCGTIVMEDDKRADILFPDFLSRQNLQNAFVESSLEQVKSEVSILLKTKNKSSNDEGNTEY